MGILQYEFMQNAIIVALVIAIICPTIGLFLVLRRLSMIGDTLAHISLAGVAAGLLSGINAYFMTLLFTVGAGLGIESFRRAYSKYAEVALAIFMAFGIGLASTLITYGKGSVANVLSYMFGSILAISSQDVLVVCILGLLIILTVIIYYRQFFFIAFDEQSAKFSGINVRKMNLIFILLTAVTITLSIRIVGVLLVSSLMVLPVAASLQLAKSFKEALWYGIGFSEVSVLIGLMVSYYLDTAPGGTIVLCAVFMLSGIVMRKQWVS